MFVSVTRLRVRAWHLLPVFLFEAERTQRQLVKAPGFREGSLLGDRRRTFWTLTGWDDQAAMRGYMMAGAHRTAMPKLARWCDEASVVHWEQDDPHLPAWEESARRMREEGRPSRVDRPSPDHAAMTFAAARTTRTVPLRPA